MIQDEKFVFVVVKHIYSGFRDEIVAFITLIKLIKMSENTFCIISFICVIFVISKLAHLGAAKMYEINRYNDVDFSALKAYACKVTVLETSDETEIECGRTCNSNINCIYFMINGTDCVLCEIYAGLVAPDDGNVYDHLTDVSDVFVKTSSGKKSFFVL